MVQAIVRVVHNLLPMIPTGRRVFCCAAPHRALRRRATPSAAAHRSPPSRRSPPWHRALCRRTALLVVAVRAPPCPAVYRHAPLPVATPHCLSPRPALCRRNLLSAAASSHLRPSRALFCCSAPSALPLPHAICRFPAPFAVAPRSLPRHLALCHRWAQRYAALSRPSPITLSKSVTAVKDLERVTIHEWSCTRRDARSRTGRTSV
jgi:hypothetical protein